MSYMLFKQLSGNETGGFNRPRMLTDTAIKSLKPQDKSYKVADRDGTCVTVISSGAITFRYDYRLNGRRETLTIGRYGLDGVSLSEAREKCLAARKLVAQGISSALPPKSALYWLSWTRSQPCRPSMAGLLPILWSSGAGSEIMQRIAAPMIGGMVSSTILTLIVIPAIYAALKARVVDQWRSAP